MPINIAISVAMPQQMPAASRARWYRVFQDPNTCLVRGDFGRGADDREFVLRIHRQEEHSCGMDIIAPNCSC